LILSSLLGWDIFWTNIFMGGLLIIYTVSGGARAVAYTQQLQLMIIFGGMFIAGYYVVHYLPAGVGFTDALTISGASGKLNIITTGISEKGFDWKDRYNIISGVIGGFFLALSYFGTDQSQVGRYLTAKDNTQSRLGLLMNGLVKVPMQFFILLLGTLLFSYYQFNPGPVFFNQSVADKAMKTSYAPELRQLDSSYQVLQVQQKSNSIAFVDKQDAASRHVFQTTRQTMDSLQKEYKSVLKKAVPTSDTNDTNYIFLRFVVDHLPAGLVGLLIAIIFLAAWGSIAAALNSQAACTVIDFHIRLRGKKHDSTQIEASMQEYRVSKYYTLGWGIFSIITAELATGMGSLIEAVNVLGSLFYGVILGIFLVALYFKKISGPAVFRAAILGECLVVACFLLDKWGYIGLGFLWLNVIGAIVVVLLALAFQFFLPSIRQSIGVAEETGVG
jgi:Na+/proline symporter